MTAAYDFYYNVDSNRVLGSPEFPSFTVSAIDIDDQGGLEPTDATTLSLEIQQGFLRNTLQVEVEIVGVGSDGSLLVEAGEFSGSAPAAIAVLLPQPGDILYLTDTPDLNGSNLDDLGVFDVEDPSIPTDQEFTCSEGQTGGFVVGTVTASDNEAVTGFAIASGNQNGFFAIDAAGEISLTAAGAAAAAASNDFETGPNSFSLTVETMDAAGNMGTGVVNVLVTDVDEMPQILGTNRADVLFGSRDGETIDGRGGSDFIFGGKGDDVILGGRGRDFLTGGTGDDQITGGIGKDVIVGGRGDDLFVLTEGRGRDLILDFEQGQDKFGLQSGLTFDDLSFAGNRILLGSDLLAVAYDFQTSQLTADDFLLI